MFTSVKLARTLEARMMWALRILRGTFATRATELRRGETDELNPSAYCPHPAGDCPPNLVRRIFLDVMASRDRHHGLCRQPADEGEILVVGKDRARLGLEE